MKTKILKWDNKLVLRIPDALANELGIGENSLVELSVYDGQLIVKPIREYTLDDLLDGITDENRHDEVDWGSAVGKEVW